MNSLFNGWAWRPPAHWPRITTVDMHTGGEPLRVITSGLPPLEGRSVLEKRRYFREHYDYLRTCLIWEPRGHADMYGAVISSSETADLDVFFLHNEGYSTMCGHAIIAITKLAIETELVRKSSHDSPLIIDVPAGTVHARATMDGPSVREVSFRNVPSFVYLRDQEVAVPEVGRVRFDVAYGGAFYTIVEAASLGLALTGEHCSELIGYGRRIKRAVMAQFQIEHPYEPDLSFLYGTILTGPASTPGHHSRNVAIFADGELDRSATGTGVSARAALHYAKGELLAGEEITIESILGTTMRVQTVAKTKFGPYDAIIPEVSGTASFTGNHEFYVDHNDPLRHGFMLR